MSSDVVGEMPGHPLNSAFHNGTSVKAINEGLLNNSHFQRAVLAAEKEFEERAAEIKKAKDAGRPLMTGSPDRAATSAFLEAIADPRYGETGGMGGLSGLSGLSGMSGS
ncbi:MAG: hypothetical protein U0796_02805 [Gemmatales bacterium]